MVSPAEQEPRHEGDKSRERIAAEAFVKLVRERVGSINEDAYYRYIGRPSLLVQDCIQFTHSRDEADYYSITAGPGVSEDASIHVTYDYELQDSDVIEAKEEAGEEVLPDSVRIELGNVNLDTLKGDERERALQLVENTVADLPELLESSYVLETLR